MAFRIVANDRQQVKEKVDKQKVGLKEQFDWCAQMTSHIAAVKSIAGRENVKNQAVKTLLKEDLTPWVVL